MSITCTKCGYEQNPDGALKCLKCMGTLPVAGTTPAEPDPTKPKATIKCSACGVENDAPARHCGQCGARLIPEQPSGPKTIKCEKCGAENDPKFKFCNQCGAKLGGSPPPPPPLITPAAKYKLVHKSTNTEIPLREGKSPIYIGRPGGSNPPDIDATRFPNSNIVSRDHASLIIEPSGEVYLEDLKGANANGTYINNYTKKLASGERQLLKDGDQIMLGIDDKVVFVFHKGRL